jgi:phospholipid/cholesterol/gamma-HCH transport system substrate-binding protein
VSRLPKIPSILDLNRIAVGLVSVVVVVAVCAAAFAVGALGLTKRTYSMSGAFSDASGIGKGADVEMAGISIGTVTGVHPDYQLGQVIITWNINRGIHLGADTTASLSLQNLLGGEYVRLAGPVEPPYLEQLPASQRRIPLSRTATTFTVNGVLGTAAQDVQAIDPATVNHVLTELTTVLDGTQTDLAPLLTNLATVSAAVNDRDAQLQQLVANAQSVSGTLASKDQELGQLIDTADGLLSQLIARRDQLQAVLGAGSSAVTQLTALVSSERVRLDAILQDLHVALQAAGQQLPEIDQGFAWAGPTFAGLATVADQGDWTDIVASGFSPDVIGILSQAVGGSK